MSSLDINLLDDILGETVRKFNDSREAVDNIINRIRKLQLSTGQEIEEIDAKLSRSVRDEGRSSYEEKGGIAGENPSEYTTGDSIRNCNDHSLLEIGQDRLRKRQQYPVQEGNRLENLHKELLEIVEEGESLSVQIKEAIIYLVNNLKGMYKLINELQSKEDVVKAIIRAQEEERKSIAREIHDGPAQAISNVVIRAEICRQLGSNNDILMEELDGLEKTANSSLEDIRRIIFNLRPMHLDDLGLIYALRKYCEEFEKQTGIRVKIVCKGDEKRFEETTEISIFRIIQEILNNARKHSKADTITIEAAFTPLHIAVKVKDNGVGFDPEKVDYTKHFGLKGIKERVNLLKGTLFITSEPYEGTEICIEIPVK